MYERSSDAGSVFISTGPFAVLLILVICGWYRKKDDKARVLFVFHAVALFYSLVFSRKSLLMKAFFVSDTKYHHAMNSVKIALCVG